MPDTTPSNHDITKVFVSYSRKDRRVVTRLVDALVEAPDVEVFRDTDDILPTEEWKGRLEQLIAEADTIVFVLSPHSAVSEVCRWEVDYAESLNKRVAPIVIQDVDAAAIPKALTKYNYIFFTDKREFDASLGNLVSALNTDIDWIREHTRLGALAARWHGQGRSGELMLRGGQLVAAEHWLVSQPGNAPDPTSLHRELIGLSRHTATRRQRSWLGGAVAVALLSIGLAVWSEINRQKAVEQRERVERVLERTTEATKELVVDIANKYANQRGIPRAMIIGILQQSRKLIAELETIGETRPELLRNGGFALAELSDALRRQGDRQSALETARATVNVFERLRASQPGDPAWLGGLVLGYDRLGDVYYDLGHPAEALDAYEKALQQVNALPPSDSRKRYAAVAYENIGTIREHNGDTKEALRFFTDSRTLREELLKLDAGSDTLRRDLAVSHEKVGNIHFALGDYTAALTAYQQSLDITDRLAASNSGNARWQEDLATAHQKVGDALWARNMPAKALKHFGKNLELATALHQSDPQWRPWRVSVLISLERIATATFRLEKFAEAARHFESALRHAYTILESDVTQTDWLDNVSRLAQSTCLALFNAGRPEDALVRAEDAVEVARRSIAAGVNAPGIEADLRNNVAWFALFNVAYDKALASADTAIGLVPDTPIYLANRAHALMFLGRTDEARTLYFKLSKNTADGGSITADFALFRKASLATALMQEIEASRSSQTSQ